jgi:hypothetical protein
LHLQARDEKSPYIHVVQAVRKLHQLGNGIQIIAEIIGFTVAIATIAPG